MHPRSVLHRRQEVSGVSLKKKKFLNTSKEDQPSKNITFQPEQDHL